MPSFYILREAHLIQKDRDDPSLTFCKVIFTEILNGTTKLPLLLTAEHPENALSEAISLFPFLRFHLAVQDAESYIHHIRARANAKANRALLRSAEAESVGA